MLLDGCKAAIPPFEVKSLVVRFATTGMEIAVTGTTTLVSKTAEDILSFTFHQLHTVTFVTVETTDQR
jgi:hypothetical protein